MKNPNDTIGNRSRDLPVCSAVPQPLRHGNVCVLHATCYMQLINVKHNVGQVRHYALPVPDAFPHVVRTLANR
jgi:hypothetical protein